jgi:hypothetical protein
LTVIGYARVSTTDQDLSIREVIWAENRSATASKAAMRSVPCRIFARRRRVDDHPHRLLWRFDLTLVDEGRTR